MTLIGDLKGRKKKEKKKEKKKQVQLLYKDSYRCWHAHCKTASIEIKNPIILSVSKKI